MITLSALEASRKSNKTHKQCQMLTKLLKLYSYQTQASYSYQILLLCYFLLIPFWYFSLKPIRYFENSHYSVFLTLASIIKHGCKSQIFIFHLLSTAKRLNCVTPSPKASTGIHGPANEVTTIYKTKSTFSYLTVSKLELDNNTPYSLNLQYFKTLLINPQNNSIF